MGITSHDAHTSCVDASLYAGAVNVDAPLLEDFRGRVAAKSTVLGCSWSRTLLPDPGRLPWPEHESFLREVEAIARTVLITFAESYTIYSIHYVSMSVQHIR